MNKNFTNLLIFAAGVLIGSAVTYKCIKTKYENMADDEIKEMKEYYEGKYKTPEKETPVPKQEAPTPKSEASHLISSLGYAQSDKEPEVKKMPANEPYVIPPEEFAEIDDYESVSYTYYADEVLTDEDDEPVTDIDGTVGRDFASHFGQYEDDSVFVRNDILKKDFEILRDLRNYFDVMTRSQNPSED